MLIINATETLLKYFGRRIVFISNLIYLIADMLSFSPGH